MIEVKRPVIKYIKNLPSDVEQAVEAYITGRLAVFNKKPSESTYIPQIPAESKETREIPKVNTVSTPYTSSFRALLPPPRKTRHHLFLDNIEFISPAFSDEQLEKQWLTLYNDSKENTIKFAQALLRFKYEFQGEASNYKQYGSEKKSYITIFKEAVKLRDNIHRFTDPGEDHLLSDSFFPLKDALEDFIEKAPNTIRAYNNYVEDSIRFDKSFLAVGRELSNGGASFFARRISTFFRTHFDKPYHEINASFVNAIYNTEYTGDEIRKKTKNIHTLLLKEENWA